MKTRILGESQKSDDYRHEFTDPVFIPLINSRITIDVYRQAGLDEDVENIDLFLTSLIGQTENDKTLLERRIYEHYQIILENSDPDCIPCRLSGHKDVWLYCSFSHGSIRRVPVRGNNLHIEIHGSCAWNEEHGISLIYCNGTDLVRVTQNDGWIHNPD